MFVSLDFPLFFIKEGAKAYDCFDVEMIRRLVQKEQVMGPVMYVCRKKLSVNIRPVSSNITEAFFKVSLHGAHISLRKKNSRCANTKMT